MSNRLDRILSSRYRHARRAHALTALAALALVLLGSACGPAQAPRPALSPDAQMLVERFKQNPNSQVRVKCLADLIRLQQQPQVASDLFDSLSQPEKVALFSPADYKAVAAELVIVAQQFYTDLPDDAPGNEVLRAMYSALDTLDGTQARVLAVEIQRWLRGRASASASQYAAAVEIYTTALNLNRLNTGLRLDRAVAEARLGDLVPALDDLAEVLRLKPDRVWKLRVQNVLIGQPALVNALAKQPEKYPALIGLVPTPTLMPAPNTPTQTPALVSPAATLPPTLTPALSTPTVTHTAVPAPAVGPAPTARAVAIPQALAPSPAAVCRNPVTFRWISAPLQWYEKYRVRVRYNSAETGRVELMTSERLAEPAWRAALPEQVTVGGARYAVYGEVEWQVLINDTTTGQTVGQSPWFRFYFSALSGQSCP